MSAFFDRPRCLTAVSVDRMRQFVTFCERGLGLDASTFGGHSLRAGFVTSAVKRGANLIKITDVTGHKSLEMLKAYSRDAEAFVGHAGAGLL
jgi:site-specific recombinase XerD